MYARVVRFTDVDAARFETLISRVNESDGPPEGVKSAGLQLLHDADQGTAIAYQLYETVEDMTESAKVFEAMDADDTPGTRVSVDTCEIKLDVKT